MARPTPGRSAQRQPLADRTPLTRASGSTRIAVDLLGGDDAPAVVVDGALRACAADPTLQLLLVGPRAVVDEAVAAFPAEQRGRLTVRVAAEAVGMSDAPARASRPDTSIRAAVHAIADGSADALVSAGASGATVTAASLGLGRLRAVRRPALAAVIPAAAGPLVLLDVGGSLDAGPATLVCTGLLGAAYAAAAHGVAAPRVGLLSIGVEAGKGDRVRRATAPLLAAVTFPAHGRYVGLVEGQQVSLGEHADVVVTDGFTGNVLLKGIEGAFKLARTPRPAPRAAALLGVAGTVVVCHGAADGADVASGIALAAQLHRRAVMTELARALGEVGESNE